MHVSNLIRTWEIERSGFFPSVTSLGKKKSWMLCVVND